MTCTVKQYLWMTFNIVRYVIATLSDRMGASL